MKGTKQLHVSFNFGIFKINSNFLRIKETKPLFSCNFGIFKINSNLAVRKHRLLQSFCVIVKERTKVQIKKREKEIILNSRLLRLS